MHSDGAARADGRAGRRGGALVLVLLFGTATLMLVSTMLALTRSSVVQEFDRHQDRQLHGVLKAAIAMAVNEVNLERRLGAAYVDPEGNGPGALGGADRKGLELVGPGGRRLGVYRVVIERGSTRYGAPKDILVATAAWPDFTRPTRVLVAEVELERQTLPLPANALSVTGEYDKTKKFFNIDKKSDVSISAPAADVPAVDIGSPDLYAEFVGQIAPELAVLEGADVKSPGTLVSGADTVANGGGPVMSEETLQAVRTGLEDRVAAVTPTATSIGASDLVVGGTLVLPKGVYRVPGKLVLPPNTRIRGAGTLIVENDVQLAPTSGLQWDGDLVVIEDAKAKLSVQPGASLAQKGGVLAVVSDDAGSKVSFKKGSLVSIGTAAAPSALVILAGSSNDSASLVFKDLDMTVHGLVALMGSKKVEVKFDSGDANIVGSLALVLAEGSSAKTELKVEVRKGSYVDLEFDRAAFDGALERLGLFLDPTSSLLPATVTAYWERSMVEVLALQEQVMTTVPYAGWGAP